MSRSRHGNLPFLCLCSPSTCPPTLTSGNSNELLLAKFKATDINLLPSKIIRRVNHLLEQMSIFPPSDDKIFPAPTLKSMRNAICHTRRQIQRQMRQTQTMTHNFRKQLKKGVRNSPLSKHMSEDYVLGCLDAVITTFLITACAVAVRKSTRRFRTTDDIPMSFVRRQGRLHGVVIAVRDGDNVRIQHTPFLHRVIPHLRYRARRSAKLLSESTVNIRLAGVDAPECVHGGRPGQPYGKQARTWLQKFATGRYVHCRLHSVDQYRRVIATVYVKHRNPFLSRFGLGSKNVGLELVRAGFATVYTGGGAQYGGTRALGRYVQAEALARKSKIGMWAKGEESVVLPSEFKRLIKASVAPVSGRSGLSKTDLKRSPQRSTGESSERENGVPISQVLRIALDAYQWLRRLR